MVVLGDEPKARRAVCEASSGVGDMRRSGVMGMAQANIRSLIDCVRFLWQRHPVQTSVLLFWSAFWLFVCVGALYAALRGWMIS